MKRVEEALNALKEDGFDGSVAAHMIFEQITNKWLAIHEATGVKRGSVRVRKKEVKILSSYFAKSPIANITHNMYQNMLIDLDKKGYARTTISGVNTCANMGIFARPLEKVHFKIS